MRLLLTGAWRDAERYLPLLEKRGHEVRLLPFEDGELPCSPDWVEGVVCNGLFLHHGIDEFPSLRLIQLTSAGLDRVPVEAIRSRGIALCNARGVYSVPMAEHAVAAALWFYREMRFFTDNQRKRLWQKSRALRELYGKTVCIIGCGSVGSACAERFAAFGCRVTGVDVYPRESGVFETIFGLDALGEAVGGADVVVLALPLTGQTEGLVDGAFLSLLKDGCVLINIARGKIVDTGALVQALTQRRLYAALDVFEDEPLEEDSPLWTMENVLITPHNSFVGDGNGERLSALILKHLLGA